MNELGEVGENFDELEAGIRKAMSVTDRPSLVIVRTIIGTPAPKSSDTPAAHGYAIFDDEIAATKELIGLPPDKTFYTDPDVVAQYRQAGVRGRVVREAWQKRVAAFDGDRVSLESQLSGTGLPGWEESLPTFEAGDSIATRKASNITLQALSSVVPGLSGGGADLTGNTGTVIKDHGVFSAADPGGRQIYFGVREHGMGAIANGMALHGWLDSCRWNFSGVRGLHARGGTTGSHLRCARHICLESRFGRRGRRWPDASAGGTGGVFESYSGPEGDPAG